jgi:transmembrane sensor
MKRSNALEPTSANRLELAAAWLVKLEAVGEAQFTPEDLQAWDDWAADEANRAAFDELATLRQQIKAISTVRRPTRAELIADRVSDADPGAAGPVVATRRGWSLALAAGLLLTIASLLALRFFNSLPYPTPQIEAKTYSTRTGEQRRFALPDGSIITEGGASVLSVIYTARQRNVTLDRGEALFHVAHNVARPFRVHAGSGVITAVGTQFNVLRAAQRVTVTVTEGTVEVAPAPVLQAAARPQDSSRPTASRWLPVRVAHGEEMSYQSQGEATAIEHVDPKVAIAWSRGTLVYDRRPLSEVIDDVTRYWGHQVTLGPGTGELLYSGTVGERNIGAWIQGLPKIFPVNVSETNGGEVSIRLREQ